MAQRLRTQGAGVCGPLGPRPPLLQHAQLLACFSSSTIVAHCQGEEMKPNWLSAARQALSHSLRNLGRGGAGPGSGPGIGLAAAQGSVGSKLKVGPLPLLRGREAHLKRRCDVSTRLCRARGERGTKQGTGVGAASNNQGARRRQPTRAGW